MMEDWKKVMRRDTNIHETHRSASTYTTAEYRLPKCSVVPSVCARFLLVRRRHLFTLPLFVFFKENPS
jgi:hypothetical protein